MANKKEAKIIFTAETEEFEQNIKNANSELSSLRAEMKLNEAQFQNSGDEAEFLSRKHELLNESIEANRDKQEALSEKIEVAKKIYGENSEEVAKLERQLTAAQTEEQKMLSEVNSLNDGIEKQSEVTENAGGAMEDFATMLAGAGVAKMIKEIGDAALEMTEDFEEAKAVIVEGTGATAEALNDLNEASKNAFLQIKNKDTDLTEVSEILATLNTRFHVAGDEATELTEKIINFSNHTGTKGVSTVNSIADITKRWNLDVKDSVWLLDDLVTANQSCEASVDELCGYLIENSTQFQELGYDIEDSLALLISLSDGGANISSVMSGLKKSIGNLSSVTDDVPGSFQKSIETISSCANVSEALQKEVEGTGMTIEKIFGAKAAQELATNILNGSFAVEEWTQELQKNEGALQTTTESATTMEDAWSQATNNVSVTLSEIFAPAISDVVNNFADVITSVSQIVRDTPALKTVIIGLAAVLGVLAVALGISSLISAVSKAFEILNTTMMANPIVIVIAVIAGLVAALIYAYQHCEKFRNAVNNTFAAVKDFVISAVEKITSTFKNVVSWVKNNWQGLLLLLVNPFAGAFKLIYDNCEGFRNKINDVKETVRTVIEKIKGFFSFSISWPHIPMPHFSISPSGWKIGDLLQGSIPKLNIEWYAKGAVFNKPTVIPTLNGFKGFGEAGPEAAAPISILKNYVTDAVNEANVVTIDYARLGVEVANACAKMNISLDIDGREYGRLNRRYT